METPLISVIVPVYNVREYLDDCFNSLLQQNYPKLEFIIVDDGSTDGSGAYADEFSKKDPRVRVLHQENRGLSGARNTGLKAAKGDYITFLDSDDYLLPDYVQYLFSLISKYQTKMSICAIKETRKNGKERNFGQNFSEKLMSTEESLGRMLREEGFTVVAYAKLYRRELWDGVEFPEGTIHEDLGTTYKLVAKCPRIAYGAEPKYVYRKRDNSISNSEFSNRKLDIIKQTDAMCTDIDTKFPYLLNTTNLRRMHARFSVLRQMVNAKNLDVYQKEQEQEIIKYLREHRKFITKNPYATARDKAAISAIMTHRNLFKFLWNSYSALR